MVCGIKVLRFRVRQIGDSLNGDAVAEVEGDGGAHVVDEGLDSCMRVVREGVGREPGVDVHDGEDFADYKLVTAVGVEYRGDLDGRVDFAGGEVHGDGWVGCGGGFPFDWEPVLWDFLEPSKGFFVKI